MNIVADNITSALSKIFVNLLSIFYPRLLSYYAIAQNELADEPPVDDIPTLLLGALTCATVAFASTVRVVDDVVGFFCVIGVQEACLLSIPKLILYLLLKFNLVSYTYIKTI